jgi:hypothetical protein
MGHLLKINCLDSRVNVQNFRFNECPIYTHDGASEKFSTKAAKHTKRIYTAPYLMLLMRANQLRAKERGLDTGKQDFFGPVK